MEDFTLFYLNLKTWNLIYEIIRHFTTMVIMVANFKIYFWILILYYGNFVSYVIYFIIFINKKILWYKFKKVNVCMYFSVVLCRSKASAKSTRPVLLQCSQNLYFKTK